MPYTRPFVTRFLVGYSGDSSERRLSLVVRPVDTFTGAPASVPTRVALKQLPHARAVRNQSGFFCFEELEAGKFTLIVEPDRSVANWFFLEPKAGDAWSFEFTRAITLPEQDPQKPTPIVEPIRWSPNPSYPFPDNSTLVRGTVVQGSGENRTKLAGVVVRASYERTDPEDTSLRKDQLVETQSDKNGEFVLFFQALPEATQDIAVTAVNNGQPIPEPVNVNIQEGATTKDVVLAFP